jgi:sucrose phosphorylase
LEVLVEVHAYYRKQIEIAKHVDWVYDFALPPLALHAVFNRTALYLKRWIEERPVNAITVLDTHDGIGIIDIGADASDRLGKLGLVPPAELDALVEQIHRNSKGHSFDATGAAASNLDLYQVNCTFYDALGRDDQAYLICRAIQFFLPGIPQVYYVGLLAGENDMNLLKKTGVGRDINRHFFAREEVESSLQKPVVKKLLDLIRHRNSHPAFGGSFFLKPAQDAHQLTLRWQRTDEFTELKVDFIKMEYSILTTALQNA